MVSARGAAAVAGNQCGCGCGAPVRLGNHARAGILLRRKAVPHTACQNRQTTGGDRGPAADQRAFLVERQLGFGQRPGDLDVGIEHLRRAQAEALPGYGPEFQIDALVAQVRGAMTHDVQRAGTNHQRRIRAQHTSFGAQRVGRADHVGVGLALHQRIQCLQELAEKARIHQVQLAVGQAARRRW